MMHCPVHQAKAKRPNGFTLLESLLVLAIISLATTLAFTQFYQFRQKPNLEKSIQSLSSFVNVVRQQAIVSQSVVALEIETKSGRFASRPGTKKFELDNAFSVSVETAKELVDGNAANIVFNPDGSSSGGYIQLKAASGKFGRITINWLTGNTTVVTGQERI